LQFNFFSRLRQYEHGAKRSALLRLAIASSALNKVFALALQAVAIPFVYHSLGQHRYELYVLLTAALATMALAQMGAGPGLTQGIARANAAERRDDEASLLNAAFRLSVAAAVIGGGVILTVTRLIPPDRIFGSAFANDRAEIQIVANVCVLVLMAQVVSGVVDSALAGYQEQVFSNCGSMVANFLSIGLLIFVCTHTPTVTGVILVLYGVPTLARAVNLVFLYLRRPYLLHGLFQSCRGFYAILLNVGLAFWAIEVGAMLEQHSGTYVLANLSSTQATDLFAVVYRSLSLAGAVVAIMTQPLWPAFTDAIAHRDIGWIRRSYARLRRALTVYSCLVGVIMVTAGQWIFRHLMHIDTAGNYLLFCILGVYFVANIWTHLFYVTMMGMHGIWKLAIVALSENLLMLLFGILLVPRLGASGMALAYLAASLVLPTWLLPRMMTSAIQRLSDSLEVAEEGHRQQRAPR
jgi:O-antigen/teichoic acid export membrane protein